MSNLRKVSLGEYSVEQDWDVTRTILLEVESLCSSPVDSIHYILNEDDFGKTHQAFILHKKGFIYEASVLSCKGDSLVAYSLTYEGRELLGSMRNKAVWEGIKKIAQEKKVELTAGTIRNLSTFSLKIVFVAPKRLS